VRQLAAERGYLPQNVPLVKRVAALGGDIVCAAGDVISINGRAVAQRLARDRLGRPLPGWTGCQTLDPDDVFLLMENVAGSFDGRYFGPVRRAAIIGRLAPLWTE
jgi:conjugative transfer signal peptidase TraF